jgi:hypothetical protein
MHIFNFVAIGFLIVCMLLAATKALSVDKSSGLTITAADRSPAQIAVPDATQSSRQAAPGPYDYSQQNQTDRPLERLRDLAEEEEDVLNMLD